MSTLHIERVGGKALSEAAEGWHEAIARANVSEARARRLREVAEEVFSAAMTMFENLPEGAHEDGPYSALTLAIVAMRACLDAQEAA